MRLERKDERMRGDLAAKRPGRAAAPVSGEPVAGSEGDPATSAAFSVLVVEDSWHLANAMQLLLETEGYRVIGPARNQETAMPMVAAETPSAAIVDYSLAGGTADTLIAELVDLGVPVILVSGNIPPASIADKAAAVLSKPVPSADLLATVGRVVSDRT